jgi:hypothetical protein
VGAAALEFAELGWRAASQGGDAVVEQTGGPDGCRATARRGGAELWSVAACLARKSQLHFASPDGLRLLVVDPLPDHAGADWSDAVAAMLFEKGMLVRTVAAGDLVAAARIRHMVKDFSWLAGAGGPEEPARYADSGRAVKFRTVDGRTVSLAFDGGNFPTPRPASKPEPEAPPAPKGPDTEEGAVYTWEDGEGGVHYGRGFEIPAASRGRARRVDANVGVVSVEPAPAAEATAQAPAQGQGQAKGQGQSATAPATPAPPDKTFYQRAVDLATGRPSADRPPDKKCRTENGATVCDP